MANISSNVIYVEPNYAYSYKNGIESYNADGEREIVNGISVFEMAPPLEDYCMAFQLAVVMPTKTTNGGTTEENKVIAITCTDREGQRAMSMLQGSILPGTDVTKSPFLSFLTTAALETSIDDVKKYHPNEMFGVKSIDISYQAYMTPEITIKFTDIRAASLFGQEELAHEHNGLMNNDAEASFFHCFFMMPYPLFGLVVKGYYGEAVSYELMVQNFKFNLDPSTGNYEAEARFLGYTWSILSDVTFNALVAAPYCLYGGQEYWNQKKTQSEEEGGFVVEGDIPMPTIPEIVNAYKKLKEGTSKMSKFDPDVSKNEKLTSEQTGLIALHDRMVAVMEEFGNGKQTGFVMPIDGSWKNGCVIYGSRGNCGDDKTFRGDWPKMNALINGLKDVKALCESANYSYFPTTIQLDKDATDILNNAISGGSTINIIQKMEDPSSYKRNAKDIEVLKNITAENTLNTFRNKFISSELWDQMEVDEWVYAYIINLTEWLPKLSNKIAENKEILTATEKEIKRKMQLEVAKTIGMPPTVYNITKVMFAHLETLIHCITSCEANINNLSERTYKSTNLDDTNIVKGCENTPTNSSSTSSSKEMKLCPFPEVKVTSERDGRKIVEDGWLGELSNSEELEEVKLVEEMVKAIDKLKETVDSEGASFENIDGSIGHISVAVPVVPSDIFAKKPIYNIAAIDKTNISEILGVIGLRAVYVLNAVSDIVDNAKTAGMLDAVNLYTQDKSGLSNIWLDTITSNSKDEFVDLAIKILTQKDIPSEALSYTKGGNVPWHGCGKRQLINVTEDRIKAALPLFPSPTTHWYNNYYTQNLSFELKGLGKTEITTNDIEDLAIFTYDFQNDTEGTAMFRFIGNPIDISGVMDVFDNNDVKDISGSSNIKDNYSKLKAYSTLDRNGYGEMFGEDNWVRSDFNHNAFVRTYKSANKDKSTNDYCPLTTKHNIKSARTLLLSYTFSKDIEAMSNSDTYGTAFDSNGQIISKFSGTNRDKLSHMDVYNGNNGYTSLRRNTSDNLGIYLNGDEDISEFTIPRIFGVDTNGNQSLISSVFTQEPYINAKSNYEKATMFLMSITCGKFGIDLNDCIKRFQKNDTNGKELFKFLPYTFILLLGAYIFWKKDFGTDGSSSIYFRTSKNADSPKVYKWESYVLDAFDNFTEGKKQGGLGEKLEFISTSKKVLQNFLCNEFEAWVGEDSTKKSNIDLTVNLHFKDIQNELELPIDWNTSNLIAKVLAKKPKEKTDLIDPQKALENTTLEKFLISKGLGQTFFNNYISVEKDLYGKAFILYTREDSEIVQRLTAMYIQPVVFVKFNEYLKTSGKAESGKLPNLSHLKSYLKGFYEEYRKLKRIQDTNGDTIPRQDADVSKHIKIALYKYLKILYDRWLATKYYGHKNEEHWGVKEFFNDHFHFIDQFYMDVKDIYFDMEGMVNNFEASFTQDTFSFLAFLTDMFTKAQFAFYPVQNFLDYYDERSASKMMNLFKPIPYNEALRDTPMPNQIYPDFVVLYKSEQSSEPATDDGCGDSYMLNYDEQFLPYPIRENPGIKKSRIPAFGVSYGKQYQSYFQSIEVSTESPTPTEQSLKAQYMVAGANSRTGGENGEQVQVLGQDLYTIYSKQSYSCTVQMMGDMWIQPTMYFVLTNVPTFRGSYIIQKVNHQISPGKMTTTFMGTRMANTTTPHVYNWYVGKTSQNGDANGSSIEEAYHKANIDNDCPYKIFTPGNVGGTGAWTEEMLNMTVKEFLQSGLDSLGMNAPTKTNRNKKLYDQCENESCLNMFSYILVKEIGAPDDMRSYILATAIFNTYTNSGNGMTARSLADVFQAWYPATEYSEKKNHANWSIAQRIVTEVFTQTPAILIGKTVSQGSKKALTHHLICTAHGREDGAVSCSGKTGHSYEKIEWVPNSTLKSVVEGRGDTFKLDMDILGVVNRQGDAGDHGCYNSSGKWVGSNNKKWSSFFCMGDGDNNQLYGGDDTVKCEWSAEPPKPQEESSLKTDLEDLVESIEKTCTYSNGINISKIYAEYEETAEYAIAKISIIESMDKGSKENATLFDIALNGYPSYHDETYWVVANENSASEFPIYVVLKKYSEEVSNTKRALCYNSSSGYVAIKDDITNSNTTSTGILNDYFYRSISKTYLATNGNDEKENNMLENLKDSIMSEVPNFTISSGDSMKTDGEKVFSVLSQFAPMPCGGNTASSWRGPTIDGLPQNERYSWYVKDNLLPPNE